MTTAHPPVSVCIPAYNEAASISKVIADVRRQNYKGEIEIVICDNASTDDTARIAKSQGAKVVREPRKGTRYAYDTAMRAASHDLILVTNADTRLPINWVSEIVKAYRDPKVVAVGTNQKFYSAPKWVNAFLAFSLALNPTPAMWGVSLSCRRWVMEKVGGFNQGTDLNEDSVFSLKIQKYGKMVILNHVTVLMDGRRFNRGTASAIKEWMKGFGVNALAIQARYLLTGKIESRRKTFDDVRTPPINKKNKKLA